MTHADRDGDGSSTATLHQKVEDALSGHRPSVFETRNSIQRKHDSVYRTGTASDSPTRDKKKRGYCTPHLNLARDLGKSASKHLLKLESVHNREPLDFACGRVLQPGLQCTKGVCCEILLHFRGVRRTCTATGNRHETFNAAQPTSYDTNLHTVPVPNAFIMYPDGVTGRRRLSKITPVCAWRHFYLVEGPTPRTYSCPRSQDCIYRLRCRLPSPFGHLHTTTYARPITTSLNPLHNMISRETRQGLA